VPADVAVGSTVVVVSSATVVADSIVVVGSEVAIGVPRGTSGAVVSLAATGGVVGVMMLSAVVVVVGGTGFVVASFGEAAVDETVTDVETVAEVEVEVGEARCVLVHPTITTDVATRMTRTRDQFGWDASVTGTCIGQHYKAHADWGRTVSRVDIFRYRNMMADMSRAATTADVFNAVAEASRRDILLAIGDGDVGVGDLVQRLQLTQPQVSKHLSVLRRVNLVRCRAVGRERRYTVNGAALKPIHDWVSAFEKQWNMRLDRLDDVLAELAQEPIKQEEQS
jgi:DNA-binding transcriptional ArsR family regulator